MNAPNHPRIVVDPAVWGGEPVVRGNRIAATLDEDFARAASARPGPESL